MKPVWKHIVAAVFAMLIVAYCVFGLWMSHRAISVPKCTELRVNIADWKQRQYVSEVEIKSLIQEHNLQPVGQTQQAIAWQSIEELVQKHCMVRTAECYQNVQGCACVNITQRVPLVRVVTGAETYFIDTDRKIMPVRESIKTPVLLVTGEVGKRMASHEIARFAEWLHQNPYWQQRIARVDVRNPKMIHLIQKTGSIIIMGDWQNFDRKLNKLHHWYEADSSLNFSQYAMVDVRFNGQVVGIKSVD